jgi:beta-galactosidase
VDAGVSIAAPLPPHLIEKSGTNGYGKALHYFLNYSSEPQSFVYEQPAGTDLLSNRSIATSQRVELAPWDLVIVEENQSVYPSK